MVGTTAGLDRDKGRRKVLEIADHVGAPELATQNYNLVLIHSVELEHGLSRVHADTHWCDHVALLSTGLLTLSAIKPLG